MSPTDRSSTRHPGLLIDPPSIASSLGAILALLLFVTGALVAAEYPAVMLAMIASAIGVLTVVRLLSDFTAPESVSRPFGRIIRFGPRRRYRL
ncbi:hypothetical protein [Halorubrum halodurans]|uniref:Uncharacterized protein n=1 Tax=Halorubrum halodurans TaxID=1383851 RepID=A0A256IQG6_9EURY|nr:hypothetical protein [Halorubrum halodurans]OYR58536.1 hypothetical protein DJ70_02785 [Halorubrum halodurans]